MHTSPKLAKTICKDESLVTQKKRRRRILLIFFVVILGFLFLHISGVDAKAPEILQSVVRTINPPRRIVKSSKVLPGQVQTAIVNLAQKEINSQAAKENLIINLPSETSLNTSVAEPLVERVQSLLTSDLSTRAKLKIKKIDRLIQRLSPKNNTDQTVNLIKEIGSEIDSLIKDTKIQSDRGVLALQIEQYNLILTKIILRS